MEVSRFAGRELSLSRAGGSGNSLAAANRRLVAPVAAVKEDTELQLDSGMIPGSRLLYTV
jgi:hypothetical protein